MLQTLGQTCRRPALLFLLCFFLFCALSPNAHGQKIFKKKNKAQQGDLGASAEPDKVLYDRAMGDLKHHKYITGRLNLQTLINTYPDSEYLAKAKLAIADSYYSEGGTSGLTESIAEYQDFVTFFPFLDEAAYAQMQIAMAHYRMMEKADRDNTQAQDAEEAFQTFLLHYPQSSLVPKAEQHLREVQEVLADGEFKTASFYYVKRDYPASAARLMELTERYPLYSQSPEALWMLGSTYMEAKRLTKNEDDKSHFGDLAGICYKRIVTDYPLSKRAMDAKAQLTALGMHIPPADPNALARMKQEQMYDRGHRQHAVMLKEPMKLFKTNPNVASAAHSGMPNLNPPDAGISPTDIFKRDSAGPNFTLAARPATTGDANAGAAEDTAPPVEAVASGPSSSAPSTGTAVQIIAAPETGGDAAAPAPSPDAATASPAIDAAPISPSASPAPAESSSAPAANPPAANGAAPAAPPAPEAAPAPTGAQGGTPAAQPATGTSDNSTANGKPQQSAKANPNTESTSKKKKGLHKLIPW